MEWILQLDRFIFTQINSVFTHPWLDHFFPFITDLHKTPFFKFVLIPVVLGIFIWRRGVKKGLVIFLFALLSLGAADGIGNHGFKKTIQRERPMADPHLQVIQRSPAGGYSFVSNHSINNFAFAAFTVALFPAAKIPLFLLAFIIAYSRVYNGVHYPTDVVCGALLGLLIGWAMARICKRCLHKMDSRSEVIQ